MIIWGSTGREIEQERGRFHCPECDRSRDYRLVRVSTYFTLYFIPLFETQHHGDYVQCDRCGGQYKPAVLDYRPPSDAERMLMSVKADLETGTPIQMARTKLVNAGFEAADAERVVGAAAGDELVHCPACDLWFVERVRRCSGCGGATG